MATPLPLVPSVVVYSCVVGNYDSALSPPAHQSLPVAFVCFTDNPDLDAPGWEIRPLQSPLTVTRQDLINRYHKFFPHRLFEGYDCSIYVDGNIQIIGDLSGLIHDFMASRKSFGCLHHPQRSDILSEAEECLARNKFKHRDAERLDEQLARYTQEFEVSQMGLYAACALLRKQRGEALNEWMELWWQQVNRYTVRDQLSLPYVLRRCGETPYVVDIDIFGVNPFFRRVAHRTERPKPIWRRALGRLRGRRER